MSLEVTELRAFALSIVVGFLVGIERERAHSRSREALGVRTFVLIAFLGCLTGLLPEMWIQLAITTLSFALIFLSTWLPTHAKSNGVGGLTTEFAAAAVFILGYVSFSNPEVTTLFGPLLALLLFSKERLHDWTRQLQSGELRAILILILLSVGVLPLLPDEAIDPWKLFNPHRLAFLILVLSLLQFASYWALKIWGGQKSQLLVAFLGGLVSSTATTVSISRTARDNPEDWRTSTQLILVAQLASLLELLAVLAFVSPAVVSALVLPVLAMSIVPGLAILRWRKQQSTHREPLAVRSPLDLKEVAKLTLLLTTILALVELGRRYGGTLGTEVVSFLTGLFELHGLALAQATAIANGSLSTELAVSAIRVAIVGSFFSKILLVCILARGKTALATTSLLVIAGLVLAAIPA